jgi:hypothetical protein
MIRSQKSLAVRPDTMMTAPKTSRETNGNLYNVQKFVQVGRINIGRDSEIGVFATAENEGCTCVILSLHNGETISDLLGRLDVALGKLINEHLYTDEINPPDSGIVVWPMPD